MALKLVSDSRVLPLPMPDRARRLHGGVSIRDVAHLQSALAMALEAEPLLGIFSRIAQEHVAHDGLVFDPHESGAQVSVGAEGRSRLSYGLAIEGESLGRIVMTRRRRFERAEIEAVEELLCSLVYPLRNALRYKCALDAARHDPLTGALNRGAAEDLLGREIRLAVRHGTPLSVVFLDLDHFKELNDTMGHAAGDAALRSLVDCARGAIRGTDVVGRYGGDEFVILLSNTPIAGARRVAEQVRRALEKDSIPAGTEGETLTTSLGVAEIMPGDTVATLLARADAALGRAKHSGRNRAQD